MLLKAFAVLVSISVIIKAQMQGLRFLDNNQTIPWNQENGNATFSFSPYPAQLALCMKINLDFARYTNYAGLVYIENMDTGNILLNIEISNSRGHQVVNHK